jgi:8-oxo-dGTP pyrophosphatase MutT (NUDIX family)
MALVQHVTTDAVPIRAAATVILWRKGPQRPEVVMGQRGAGAAFMPSKYVFPGGAVDQADDDGSAIPGLHDLCRRRLALLPLADQPGPEAIARAALRELDEETGLTVTPSAAMRFVFRAITPPGRGRRFDARFFLLAASDVMGDLDGFGAASGELTHLHWIGLNDARKLDLPFITEIVLSEVAAILQGQDQPGIPFFDNSGPVPAFRRLD